MSGRSQLLDALDRVDSVGALREMDRDGALTRAIPELEAGRGFEQPDLHFYNVLDHNLAAVAAFDAVVTGGADTMELHESLSWLDINESLEREIDGLSLRTLTRLACLVHDVAKPATAIFSEGRLRFPRHGPRGSVLIFGQFLFARFGVARSYAIYFGASRKLVARWVSRLALVLIVVPAHSAVIVPGFAIVTVVTAPLVFWLTLLGVRAYFRFHFVRERERLGVLAVEQVLIVIMACVVLAGGCVLGLLLYGVLNSM